LCPTVPKLIDLPISTASGTCRANQAGLMCIHNASSSADVPGSKLRCEFVIVVELEPNGDELDASWPERVPGR
jgi:hypothetical protein